MYTSIRHQQFVFGKNWMELRLKKTQNWNSSTQKSLDIQGYDELLKAQENPEYLDESMYEPREW